MEALDAVVPLVAVAAPTALVLLEVVGYDRASAAPPAAPERTGPEPVVAEPVVAEPVVAEPAEPEPAEPAGGATGDRRVAEPAPEDDGVPVSMLSGLTATEADERSWLRRVRALLIVIVLTLLTAALVGAGIYRAVSRLG